MTLPSELKYIQYSHNLEAQYLPAIRALISKDLSEPYSIYVYRYFLYQWGHLCFMVFTPRPSPSPPSCLCPLSMPTSGWSHEADTIRRSTPKTRRL